MQGRKYFHPHRAIVYHDLRCLLLSVALLCSAHHTGACQHTFHLLSIDSLTFPLSGALRQLMDADGVPADDGTPAEYLDQLALHRLDINRATVEDLASLPLMTKDAAVEIVGFRETVGRIRYLSELRNLRSLSRDMYPVLDAFTRVADMNIGDHFSPIGGTLRSRLKTESQRRRGYRTGAYRGSPYSLLNRIFISAGNHFSAGVLTEKDKGEESIVDHLSWYLMSEDLLFPGRLILGNFTFSSSQGIASGAGNLFVKGGDVINATRRRGSNLRPFLSSGESGSYCGIGAEVRLGDWTLAGFLSRHPLDASFDTSGNITSFPSSGLHRTDSEIEKKHSAQESSFGGRITFLREFGKIRISTGCAVFLNRFNRPATRPRGIGGPDAKADIVAWDFDFLVPGLNFFGEWARTVDGAIGGMCGCIASFGSNIRLALSIHTFPVRFFSFHGRSTTAASGFPSNDQGLYLGLELPVQKGSTVSLYFNQSRKPGGVMNIPFPMNENEFFCHYRVHVTPRIECRVRYRRSARNEWTSPESSVGRTHALLTRTGNDIRMQWEFRTGRDSRFLFQAEYTHRGYNRLVESERGHLFLVDASLRPLTNIRVDARAILFRTSSYESRLYVFEDEIPGDLSIPAFSGHGIRTYCLVWFEPVENLRISAKYSWTIREDATVIGSGNDLIPDRAIGNLGVQADFRW